MEKPVVSYTNNLSVNDLTKQVVDSLQSKLNEEAKRIELYMGADYHLPPEITKSDIEAWWTHIWLHSHSEESCDCEFPPDQKPVIVYARGSQDKQTRNLPPQVSATFSDCLRAGLLPIAVIAASEKGWLPIEDRPALRKALWMAGSHGVEGIALHHIDRLSRDVKTGFEIMEILGSSAKAIFTPAEMGTIAMREIRPGSELGFIQGLTEMASSNRENYTRGWKSREAIEFRRSRGLWPGQTPKLVLYKFRKAEDGEFGLDMYTQPGELPTVTVLREKRAEKTREAIKQALALDSLEPLKQVSKKWLSQASDASKGRKKNFQDFLDELVSHRLYGNNCMTRSRGENHVLDHLAVVDKQTWHSIRQLIRSHSGVPVLNSNVKGRLKGDLIEHGASSLMLDDPDLVYMCQKCGQPMEIRSNSGNISNDPKDLWKCTNCRRLTHLPNDAVIRARNAKLGRCDFCLTSGKLKVKEVTHPIWETARVRVGCNACGATWKFTPPKDHEYLDKASTKLVNFE